MDRSDQTIGEVLPIGQPQITRVEHAHAGDKSAALFSLDFGDGQPAGALVLLVARSQGVRVCEVYNHASGDSSSPLRRALEAYGHAVETIGKSGEPVQRDRFNGNAPRSA